LSTDDQPNQRPHSSWLHGDMSSTPTTPVGRVRHAAAGPWCTIGLSTFISSATQSSKEIHMSKRLQVALATALAVATVGLYAQSSSDSSTTTSTTSQSEMNRGVPDVDVDVGRNADGAIDINRANTERAQGVPGVDVDAGRNASNGTMDVNTSPNADRDAKLVGSDRTGDTNTTSSSSLEPRADRN
jgi:hypothetical protein